MSRDRMTAHSESEEAARLGVLHAEETPNARRVRGIWLSDASRRAVARSHQATTSKRGLLRKLAAQPGCLTVIAQLSSAQEERDRAYTPRSGSGQKAPRLQVHPGLATHHLWRRLSPCGYAATITRRSRR